MRFSSTLARVSSCVALAAGLAVPAHAGLIEGPDESFFTDALLTGNDNTGLSFTANQAVRLTQFNFSYGSQADTINLFNSNDTGTALATIAVPNVSGAVVVTTDTFVTVGPGWDLVAGQTYFLTAENTGAFNNVGQAFLSTSGTSFPETNADLTVNTIVIDNASVGPAGVATWVAFTDLTTVVIPEPSGLALLASAGLLAMRRRRA